MTGTEGFGWMTSVVVIALVTGCSGTTTTGTERHIDVGGGRDGSAGVINAGTGGRLVMGGATGTGGTSTDPCAGVRCASPNCRAGTTPVTPTGQCCPTSCTQTTDSGVTPACCQSDADCRAIPGAECVNTICVLPTVGGCWRDGDCPLGQTCSGSLVCPCTADCSYNVIPGKCQPSADAGTCPGTAGPPMVRVPAPDSTTYCIDSTEVTNYRYLEFIQAKTFRADGGIDTSGQDAWCSWNLAYAPQDPSCVAEFDAYARPDYPVVCIDWCDAYAYCKWAGKHLCGNIGGGSIPFLQYGDATKDEWFNACSKGGTFAYSFGNTFDPTACNGSAIGLNAVVLVGSMPKCHGGYPGLFDLSGNASEWEDSCDSATGKSDSCRVRGASFKDFNSGLSCGVGWVDNRSATRLNLGFRCCAE